MPQGSDHGNMGHSFHLVHGCLENHGDMICDNEEFLKTSNYIPIDYIQLCVSMIAGRIMVWEKFYYLPVSTNVFGIFAGDCIYVIILLVQNLSSKSKISMSHVYSHVVQMHTKCFGSWFEVLMLVFCVYLFFF
jgi:hypothetical protein